MQAVRFHPEARLELQSAAEPDPDEPDIRRAVLARFPFVLVYQLVGDAVEVIAVMHQRQKPGET